MTLNHDQCVDVIKRYESGQPTWAICGELKISSGHIKAIRHCKLIFLQMLKHFLSFCYLFEKIHLNYAHNRGM